MVEPNFKQQFLKYAKYCLLLLLTILTTINIHKSVVTKYATSTKTFHEFTDDRKLMLEDLPTLKICPILGFNENGKLNLALKADPWANGSKLEELIQNHVLKLEDFIIFTRIDMNYPNSSEVWSTHFTGVDYEGNCFSLDMIEGEADLH